MQSRNALTRLAPAKINLTLAVLGRRADGFHDLESWVVQIDLCDRLTFTPANELTLQAGDGAYAVPLDESNLIQRAARLLAQEAGVEPRVAITLNKQIPIGAGLGGGSSDAATTFLGLNDLWELHWPTARLAPLAAKIGSDVSLFLQPEAAVIRGRGERIEYLSTTPKMWVALIIPPYGVSTPLAYAKWSELSRQRISNHREVARPWEDVSHNANTLMPQLFNDLESAAFAIEPQLHDLNRQLHGLYGQPVRMTGSGSGLFTLFNNENDARSWSNAATDAVQKDCPIRTFVCKIDGIPTS